METSTTRRTGSRTRVVIGVMGLALQFIAWGIFLQGKSPAANATYEVATYLLLAVLAFTASMYMIVGPRER